MNRLREYRGDDPTSTRELERLRNTPPTPPMSDMKRRVWSALEQESLARASRASSHFFGVPMIKMAATVVAVVVLAGTAAAMIAERWIAPVLDPSVRSSGAAVPALARPALARPVSAHTLPVATSLGTKAPRSPVVPPERRRRTAGVVAIPVRPSFAPAPASAPADAQARSEVLDALVALRRDHDPTRAGALVDKYLADHPRGALREEALVLAIEAADARGDQLGGRRWARIYEVEYPRGRFRQFARSHYPSDGSGPSQDQ